NKYLIEEIKALNLPLDNIEKEMPGRFSKISDLRKFFSEINKNIKPEENVFDELKNRWREHEYDLNESLLRCINVCRNLNTDEVSSSIDIKGKALESRTVINSISKVDNSRDAYIR
ncbi:MAG: hypothetical protein J6Y29_05070, partial [Clostridiales bacterium]|nr:hypothetical protein [Clostridiales bacterium]